MADLAPSTLLPLDRVDPAELERVLDLAFGPERHTRTAYAIRQGTECLPPLCFAAYDEHSALTGTIQAFPVALTAPGGRAHPLIMVGPVAILPGRQGQGFGRALMAAQEAALDPAAPLPRVLIGDAPYYGRFGFTEAPRGWHCPGPWDPARLLIKSDNPAVLPQEGILGPWVG